MSSVVLAKRDPPGPESTEQNWEWGRRAWSQPRLKQRGNGRSAAGSNLDTEGCPGRKGALLGDCGPDVAARDRSERGVT